MHGRIEQLFSNYIYIDMYIYIYSLNRKNLGKSPRTDLTFRGIARVVTCMREGAGSACPKGGCAV